MRYELSVLGGQISNLSRFRAVYFKKNEKEKKRPWLRGRQGNTGIQREYKDIVTFTYFVTTSSTRKTSPYAPSSILFNCLNSLIDLPPHPIPGKKKKKKKKKKPGAQQ